MLGAVSRPDSIIRVYCIVILDFHVYLYVLGSSLSYYKRKQLAYDGGKALARLRGSLLKSRVTDVDAVISTVLTHNLFKE
jgi:hypothetical protein